MCWFNGVNLGPSYWLRTAPRLGFRLKAELCLHPWKPRPRPGLNRNPVPLFFAVLLLHFMVTKKAFFTPLPSWYATPRSGLFVPPAENKRVTPAAEGVGADAFWASELAVFRASEWVGDCAEALSPTTNHEAKYLSCTACLQELLLRCWLVWEGLCWHAAHPRACLRVVKIKASPTARVREAHAGKALLPLITRLASQEQPGAHQASGPRATSQTLRGCWHSESPAQAAGWKTWA